MFHQSAPQHFLERIADILQHIPQESTFNCYPFVANYLYTLPTDALTYQFYIRFVSLMSNIPSEDLLVHILCNIDLWIAAPWQQLSRIAVHWSQVLVTGFGNAFKKCFTAASISSLERIYLYFDKIETEIISKRQRAPDIDINIIRQHVDRAIVALAKISLTQKDVATLVSHTFTCKDIKQIPYYLAVIKEIASYIKNSEKIAYELHFLFLRSDPTIFIGTLRAIIALSKGTIAQHIELICCHINHLNSNIPALETIFGESRNHPEVTIIGAVIVAQLDDRARELFAKEFVEITQNTENCILVSKVRAWFVFVLINSLMTESLTTVLGQAVLNVLQRNFHFTAIDELLCFIDKLQLIGYRVSTLRYTILSKLAYSYCEKIKRK